MKSEWMAGIGRGSWRAALAALLLASLAGAGCGGEADEGALEDEVELSGQSASLATGLVATLSTPQSAASRNGLGAKLTIAGRSAGLAFASLEFTPYNVTGISLNITCQSGGTLLTKYKRFPDMTVVRFASVRLDCPLGNVTRAVANFNW